MAAMAASTIGKHSKIQRTAVQFLLRMSLFVPTSPGKAPSLIAKHLFDRLGMYFPPTSVTLRNRSRSTVSPRSRVLFYTPGRIPQCRAERKSRSARYPEKETRTDVAETQSLGQLLKRCRIAPLSGISTGRYFQMKAGYIGAALAASALSLTMIGTANAAGCMKGAVVGGVAGHYAGHHAVIGAVGGCLVGRHMAKKQAEERVAQRQQAKMQ